MLRRTVRRDRMVSLFAVGVLLFNPPILNLVGGTVFGWPALYLYLFGTWAGLIAAAAFILEGGSENEERRGDERHGDERRGDELRR
jgi:hypothetical protein